MDTKEFNFALKQYEKAKRYRKALESILKFAELRKYDVYCWSIAKTVKGVLNEVEQNIIEKEMSEKDIKILESMPPGGY